MIPGMCLADDVAYRRRRPRVLRVVPDAPRVLAHRGRAHARHARAVVAPALGRLLADGPQRDVRVVALVQRVRVVRLEVAHELVEIDDAVPVGVDRVQHLEEEQQKQATNMISNTSTDDRSVGRTSAPPLASLQCHKHARNNM